MSKITRKNRIVDLVNRSGECTVESLARKFTVSDMTIRRDLQELAGEGKVIRTHGGAAPAERVKFEFTFLNRSRANRRRKLAIAAKAAEFVRPGQTVMLGAGTTTLELARCLKSIEGLTVITTSLPIASELQFCEKIEVLLLGGFLRQNSPDLTGALTEANLENLYAEIAFLGADAIDLKGGIYDNDISLARMLDKMVGASERIYAVADHTKIGQKGLMRYSSLVKWQGLVTDGDIPNKARNSLRRSGVKLIIADY